MQTLPYSIPSIIAYTPGAAVGGVRSVNQTEDVNNSSNTTPTDVTGLSFALVSGTRYHFKFIVQGRSAATTTGLGFCFSAPAMTFSHFKIKNQQGNAGTDQYYESSSDDDLTAVLVNASVIANNTDYIFIIEGICQPSANGTLQLRCRSEVDTSQITVKNGIGYLVDPDLVAGAPTAHKDSHDPQDGSDPLDTAAAAEISAVVAAGAGSSHSLARADHVHAIVHAITDNHILTVDDASAADDDIARFTANGIEGIPYSTLRTDMGIRELLPADRTYYVRTDGNDSNTGLVDSAGGAFLTPQKAVDVLTGPTLDFGGQTVTVKFGDGTYAGGMRFDKPWTGGGEIILRGNTGNKDSVVIDRNGAGSALEVYITLPGTLWIEYFKLDTPSGVGINHWGVGTIKVKQINFVDAAVHVFSANPGSYIIVYGAYEISGDVTNCHIFANNAGASVYVDGYTVGAFTVTLTGTPDLLYGYADAGNLGEVYVSGNLTFSGSAVGYRYYVWKNGVIGAEGAGEEYFPGDTAGVEETGGQYE